MKCILQTEQSECGLACIAMVAGHFGHRIGLADLRRRFSISLKGATLAQLMRHAASINLAARPLRLDLDELHGLQRPCILHWDMHHFVVLKDIRTTLRGKVVVILDPAVGERRMPLEEVSRHFTGVALEFTPTAQFEKAAPVRKMSISQLMGRVVGLRSAIAKVICIALALEVFAIVAPLFNQFVVDEVIVGGDEELLQVLVAGFALLMFTQTAIGLARSWFLMRWSIDLAFQWTARLLFHMLRLPASYFEKRHLGDIVSRFTSIEIIKSTLTSLVVESLLDGLMAVLALAMMLAYSVKLTTVVLVGVVLYVLLRWAFYTPLREAMREMLVFAARENSNFFETVRAIVPLKLYGREIERHARWLNLKQDVINRDVATQKLSIMFKTASNALHGFQSLALLYIGAQLVMQNVLTVGMLVAFISYAATFAGRIYNLVDVFVGVKMLAIHGERVADIALEEVEPEPPFEADTRHIKSHIVLRNVRFRYAEGEPWVLNGINLEIPAGQSIALTGPSGCGKSTLCKIILGLVSPTEGEVLIDGIPVKQLGLRAYRRLIGTVMQDDVLLEGSILDNICFFDAQIDHALVEHCAKLAAVHEEIVAMPMGYQTLVGDMGSALSGGQKQRVLLARALYKQPRVLVLDEATSHLDIRNEHDVSAAIRQLELTCIMVAHRPETIKSAQRVVLVQGGVVVESSPAVRSVAVEPENAQVC